MGKLEIVFEGTGVDCYKLFIANKRKGRISRVNQENEVVLIPTWLSEPCTYTPPEPQWVDCTAGEALDAYLECKKVQEDSGSGWADMEYETAWQWMWVNKSVKYRKEA